jgi:tetratricopeptide (TPR) repeat protein
MKPHYYIVSLMLLPGFFFYSNAEAQNIRGDTIYADVNKVVRVVFPSAPGKAELLDNGSQERLYEVNDMGGNALSILVLKKEAQNQDLEVTEKDRKHLFILSYKEGSPARSIDLSTIKKIKERIAIVKKNVSNALKEANNLYEQAKGKNSMSDQALWETVKARYTGLNRVVVDPKDVNFVKSRLEEIEKQLQVIDIDTKYQQAINKGNSYFSQKRFDSAKKAYQQALEYKPGEKKFVLNSIHITDSAWAKVYIDKGDAANKVKNYALAITNYQIALSIMADDPSADYASLQDKLNQVKVLAAPDIYKTEKKNGDEAMKANDIEEARRAYNAALFVKPGDAYIIAQLEKVKVKEQEIEQDDQKEAEYQSILAKAKELADKASDAQGYELAIKEYKRASDKIPGRKFPKKKIDELNRLKEIAKAQ